MSAKDPQTAPVDIGSDEFREWAMAQPRPSRSTEDEAPEPIELQEEPVPIELVEVEPVGDVPEPTSDPTGVAEPEDQSRDDAAAEETK